MKKIKTAKKKVVKRKKKKKIGYWEDVFANNDFSFGFKYDDYDIK
jgi:hypothetical protein